MRPGEWVTVNLWESEQAAARGRAAIGVYVDRLESASSVAASELAGSGKVISTDLIRETA